MKSSKSYKSKVKNKKHLTKKHISKSKKQLNKSKKHHRISKPKGKRMQRGGGNIEKKVHQIWFGGGDPKYRSYLFEHNEAICKKLGFKYHLWIESDRTEDNFPITYKYQEKCIEIGKESGQNRLAQVADLARIELIYSYGGIYIDSIFEISDEFLCSISDLSQKNKYEFIGANEDPCDLDCKGFEGNKYLSNSFLAGPKGSYIFKRLLESERLDEIDYQSQYVNRTTGPYYIRSAINDEDIKNNVIYLFKSSSIYPFNVNETPYQPMRPNKCLYTEMEDENGKSINEGEPGTENYVKIKDGQYLLKNCIKSLRKKDDSILALYQSGLGGTWSF